MKPVFAIFATATLAIFGGPASAQEWTVGDQGVNWSVLSNSPVGATPADAFVPDDPTAATFNPDPWIEDTGDQMTTAGDGQPKGDFLKGPSREKKIRLDCESSTIKRKDNILGKGIAAFGHFHEGYGSVDWDENSDYTSLRLDPDSTCAGGPVNATNYMEPATLKKLPNGAVVAVVAQDQANYYVLGVQSEPNHATWIRPGMQFIIGGNPMNFNDTARRAAYEAAGFLYPGGPDTPAGFLGYYCTTPAGSDPAVVIESARRKNQYGVALTDKARYLRGPNGEDPWGGTCVGTTEAPARITRDLVAPGCWDRYNLTSPDGRGQFWYEATKADSSIVDACPTTTSGESYAHVPELQVKVIYETTGFADYGEWYIASDRMPPEMTLTQDIDPNTGLPCALDPVTQGDPCSLDPCRRIGPWFCNGATAHADYTYGWWSPVFDTMQRECLGIPVHGIDPADGPAECNAGQIDRYTKLYYGPSPNTALTGGCAVILQCRDATPGKPLERHTVVPGLEQDSVMVEHRH